LRGRFYLARLQLSLGVRRILGHLVTFRTAGACMVTLLVACSRASDGDSPTQLRGFVDAGWPGPSGTPASGVALGVASNHSACAPITDSARTDSRGLFSLTIPPASRESWHLCMRLVGTNWARGASPVFRYDGLGIDSLRVYCRGHGPSGSPECRFVAWNAPMRWPGGEGYDSVPKPPNER
jgi:hypothetical protein